MECFVMLIVGLGIVALFGGDSSHSSSSSSSGYYNNSNIDHKGNNDLDRTRQIDLDSHLRRKAEENNERYYHY